MDKKTPLTVQHFWELGFIKDGFNGYELRIGQFKPDDRVLNLNGDYLFIRQRNNDKRHEDSLVVLWNKDLMKTFYVEQMIALIFSLTGVNKFIQSQSL